MTEQWTPKTLHLEIPLSFSSLHLQLQFVGEDLSVLVYGGEHAHIGCTVLSIPRPSLTDSQKTSCTSSVLNVTGHKDEIICRYLSEVIKMCIRDRHPATIMTCCRVLSDSLYKIISLKLFFISLRMPCKLPR